MLSASLPLSKVAWSDISSAGEEPYVCRLVLVTVEGVQQVEVEAELDADRSDLFNLIQYPSSDSTAIRPLPGWG